jgi:phosphatidylethanolamine-binding protein (PEBP) family uncharacterized protein
MSCPGLLVVSGIKVHCGKDAPLHPPVFTVSKLPPDAVYFAVIFVDLDPRAHGFVHWLAWNMDVATNTERAEGPNSYGYKGYGPPCPPRSHTNGHAYKFTVYAYTTKITGNPKTPQQLLTLIHAAHMVGTCSQQLQFKSG